jgi:cold shock protein
MTALQSRSYGVVREFDRTRGCGIIEGETGEQVFVRYSAIVGHGVRTLQIGDRVAFDIDRTSKRLNAVRVSRT